MTVAVAEPSYLKACCADLWSHPGVRLLAGDHLHPGGQELTERALALLRLSPSQWLLDLGAGPGASAAVAARRGTNVVAVDLSPRAAAEASGTPAVRGVAGDAERLPLADASVGGAIAECVLSAVPDKASAVREIRRVLVPGGRFALSDVVLEGTLPAELDSFVAWIACAAGALPADGYARLLVEHGFSIEQSEERPGALSELVAQARRRLALVQGAVATGLIDISGIGVPPELISAGEHLLGLAAAAADAGVLSYVLIVAVR